jgi:hypothetical protein
VVRRGLVLLVVLATAGLAAATGGQAGVCSPTPNFGGGPDRSPPLRAKIGTGHVLTGVVLSPTCTPIPHARVSFWQSNRNGVYTPSGGGAVMTAKSGRFRFQGPRPTPYDGQPAHIHIKVEAPGFVTLYTEYLPRPGSTRGAVRLVLLPSDL